MILITTANDEIFKNNSNSKNILLLGEWCNLYKKDTINKNIPTVNYIWDKTSYKKGHIYLENLRKKTIKQLTLKMNTYLNIEEDENYYFRILNYWLAYYIDQLYDKYSNIKYAFENYNIVYTHVLDKNQYYYPTSLGDFLTKSFYDQNDLLPFQIYSQIIELIYPKKTKTISLKKAHINHQNITCNPICYKDIIKTFKLKANRFIQKVMNKGKSITVCNSNNFLEYNMLKKLTSYQLKSRYKYIVNNFNYKLDFCDLIDFESRESISLELNCENEFEYILSNLFFKHLPIRYLEDHLNIRNQVLNKYIPKTDYFHGYLMGNLIFDFFYALNKDIKVLQHQHGGGYGITEADSRHLAEYKYGDFISWGWGRYKLTTPKIVLKEYQKQKNEPYHILLSFSNFPRYTLIITPSIQSSIYHNNYLNLQINLINTLSKNYNFYTLDNIHSNKEDTKSFINQIIRQTNNLKIIKNTFIKEVYRKNYLIISLASQTTGLESLSINIPTLLLLEEEYYSYSETFKNFIPSMKEVGIFHNNLASLTKHLENINYDIQSWWYAKKTQKVKNDFIEHFARNSKSWIEDWMQFYSNLDKENI